MTSPKPSEPAPSAAMALTERDIERAWLRTTDRFIISKAAALHFARELGAVSTTEAMQPAEPRSIADLQRELGWLQQELAVRIGGDPRESVTVTLDPFVGWRHPAPNAEAPTVPTHPTVTVQVGGAEAMQAAPPAEPPARPGLAASAEFRADPANAALLETARAEVREIVAPIVGEKTKPTAGSEPLREALLEARKYVHAASCEGESYVRSKQAARVLRQIDVALAAAQEQRHD